VFCSAARTSTFLLYVLEAAAAMTAAPTSPRSSFGCHKQPLRKPGPRQSINAVCRRVCNVSTASHWLQLNWEGGATGSAAPKKRASQGRRRHQSGGAIRTAASQRPAAPSERRRRRGWRRHQSGGVAGAGGVIRAAAPSERRLIISVRRKGVGANRKAASKLCHDLWLASSTVKG